MARLRIERTACPRPALVLTDTPRPDCPDCGGDGGTAYDHGDPETGEYAGTEWESCTCWNQQRCWVLLPLPRRRWRPRRHPDPWAANGYSDEPPF
ncbi:hypothetical protein ACFWY6_42995 [Streptomyces sp. NPDC059037]|uniref:hypothetical protein n=1 Tax=Streptomyces sp. NPDC059037 TaxID=3346710 RepID=UPI0036ABAB0E